MRPVMTVAIWTAEGPCTFTWTCGGPYIDVTFPSGFGPTEVINVWDYELDQAVIATWQEFNETCHDHLSSWVEDDMLPIYCDNAALCGPTKTRR